MKIPDSIKLQENAFEKWINNILVFASPVLLVYFISIVGIINAHNGVVQLQDFIPTSFTLGSFSIYIINSAIDYLKKLQSH